MEVDASKGRVETVVNRRFDDERVDDGAMFVFAEIDEEYPAGSFYVKRCGLSPDQRKWKKKQGILCKAALDDYYFSRLQYAYRRANFQQVFRKYLKSTNMGLEGLETSLRRSHNYGVEQARSEKLANLNDAYRYERRNAEAEDSMAWGAFFSGMASGASNAYAHSQQLRQSSTPTYTAAPQLISDKYGQSYSQGQFACGLRPMASIGCRIGRCVNGHWEQICDSNAQLSCGLRPIPKIGCRIGRCVDGEWEQVCDSNSTLECGLRPLPHIGCQIGRCISGSWEQVCN